MNQRTTGLMNPVLFGFSHLRDGSIQRETDIRRVSSHLSKYPCHYCLLCHHLGPRRNPAPLRTASCMTRILAAIFELFHHENERLQLSRRTSGLYASLNHQFPKTPNLSQNANPRLSAPSGECHVTTKVAENLTGSQQTLRPCWVERLVDNRVGSHSLRQTVRQSYGI